MSCLPKPVLRGHLGRKGLYTIIGGLLSGTTGAGLFYFLVAKPRSQKYEEFLKTYDAEAHVKDLIKWGYFKTISQK